MIKNINKFTPVRDSLVYVRETDKKWKEEMEEKWKQRGNKEKKNERRKEQKGNKMIKKSKKIIGLICSKNSFNLITCGTEENERAIII